MTNIPLIKYYIFDSNKLILLPSADGLSYLEMNKQSYFRSDKVVGKPFNKSTTLIAGQSVPCLEAEFDSSVLHLSCEQNIALNEIKFRVYTSGQITYHWKLPYMTEKARYQEVLP